MRICTRHPLQGIALAGQQHKSICYIFKCLIAYKQLTLYSAIFNQHLSFTFIISIQSGGNGLAPNRILLHLDMPPSLWLVF